MSTVSSLALCSDCGNYSDDVWETKAGNIYCRDCIVATHCQDCNRRLHLPRPRFIELGGRPYCRECIPHERESHAPSPHLAWRVVIGSVRLLLKVILGIVGVFITLALLRLLLVGGVALLSFEYSSLEAGGIIAGMMIVVLLLDKLLR